MRRAWARLRASTFALPALIAASSLLGLLAALLSNGAGHALAWAALGVPVLVGASGLRGR